MELINKITKIIFQFKLHNYNIVFTDYLLTLFLVPTIVLIIFKVLLSFKKTERVFFTIYEMFLNNFTDSLGKEIEPYVPFLFSIFCFLYSFNFFSLLPFLYPITTNFKFNFTISVMIFLLLIVLIFRTHGIKAWKPFLPSGLPMVLKPFIFLIEFILFFVKPITLAFRISLNLAIGHIILEIFSSFAKGGVSNIPSLIIVTLMTIFEIMIGILQSYVFVTLSAVYIKDMISEEH